MEPIKVPADTIIIGLTGSICSGCSEFAKWLKESKGYEFYSLSTPIHEIAEEKLRNGDIKEINQKVLQDIGNMLRLEKQPWILAEIALQKLDERFQKAPFEKVVIDSMRNLGEVQYLRKWPNFYLVSIHADFKERWDRWTKKHGDSGLDAFKDINQRDAEQNLSYGQQVEACCDASDIVINNPDVARVIDLKNPLSRKKYFEDKFSKYLNLIENGPQLDHRPKLQEKLMTLAFMESLSSSCTQRKVGAVIATDQGDILSTGHNHVPDGEEPCLTKYGECYRKHLRKKQAMLIEYCHRCGTKIVQKCPKCSSQFTGYSSKCKNCQTDIDFNYECTNLKCHSKVYQELTIGGKKSVGKGLDVCRALHAEENAIVSLAKRGKTGAEGTTLYSTTFPCTLCANKVVQSKINRVVYSEPYTMEEAENLLKAHDIKIERFEGVKSTAFFRLYGSRMEAINER